MSAYVVGVRHIDAMVTAFCEGPTGLEDFAGEYDHVPGMPMQNGWRPVTWFTEDPEGTSLETLDYIRREARQSDGQDKRSELGRLLLAENRRSVAFRYNESPEDDLPGRIGDPLPGEYVYRHFPRVPWRRLLGLIACWRYQTCETPGYSLTEAWRAVDALEGAVVGHLADGWDLRDEEAAKVDELERIPAEVYRKLMES